MLDQAHMTSLFENATEGIILTGSHGNILLVNPATERIFNYDSSELIGQPIEILIPDQLKTPHHKMREGFYQKPSNRVMGQGRDLNGRKKDGSKIPVEVSLSHYTKENDLFVIAFVVDITRRKEIEQDMIAQQKQLEQVSTEIRKLNAELEIKVEQRTMILKEALQRLEQSQKELSEALDKEKQLNEIKSRFVSMASHEFRTPLSTVLSSASLLSKYTTTEQQDKRNRHTDKIKSSVKQLNDILEDFLSLGKLDEGKKESQCSEFDLKALTTETINELNRLLKKDQHFEMNYDGSTKVYSDKKLLKNILINLITNSVKFSGEGSEIRINTKVDKEKAVVSIADQGIGIGEEDQQHLFTTFFRGANATNIQGTGLGLHIVKRYIDILNGTLQLKSKLNHGTTVTFSIPVNH
ncbi:MAG: PAS domain-containing sensor histidine kinase [Chitinophagaceae bacterium]